MSAAIAAGAFTGLQCFIDSIMYASSVLPNDLAIAIQSALLGYALMQLVVSWYSGVRVLIAPVSYEVIPFLMRLSVIVGAANLGAPSTTATMLAASLLINGLSAVLFGLLSCLPIGGALARLLPPVMQSGIFATIGWGIYTLAFESMSVAGPEAAWAADGGGLAQFVEGARLWLPAHGLGIGLWLASRQTSHPALFPLFAIGLTCTTHAVRLASGTSLAEARAAHWLMAEAQGEPFWTLWTRGLFSGAVRRAAGMKKAAPLRGGAGWDVLFQRDAASELVSAVLFGPVINTVLNLVLIGPVIGEAVDTPTELRAHAAGSLAAAVGGGYSNYLAVSNTAIHLKCGGATKASCYVAAGVAALFFLFHPLFVVVGYVPTLLAAATCVYIGVDFLWDNLVASALERGYVAAAASYAVFAVCLQAGMLNGVIVCGAAFQAHAAYERRQNPPPAAAAVPAPAAAAPAAAASRSKSPEAAGKPPASPRRSPRCAKKTS